MLCPALSVRLFYFILFFFLHVGGASGTKSRNKWVEFKTAATQNGRSGETVLCVCPPPLPPNPPSSSQYFRLRRRINLAGPVFWVPQIRPRVIARPYLKPQPHHGHGQESLAMDAINLHLDRRRLSAEAQLLNRSTQHRNVHHGTVTEKWRNSSRHFGPRGRRCWTRKCAKNWSQNWRRAVFVDHS